MYQIKEMSITQFSRTFSAKWWRQGGFSFHHFPLYQITSLAFKMESYLQKRPM